MTTPTLSFPPVVCPDLLADSTVFDPNRDKDVDTHRQTTSDPSFWISLHVQSFDGVRWRSVMKTGNYYEEGITAWFHQILQGIISVADSTPPLVLDIGMNVGWFTLYSRAHGFHVASFDPYMVMHLRVCESLVLNHWDTDGSVVTFPYGLGETQSEMELITGRNPGASSLRDNRPAMRSNVVSVQVAVLDEIAEEQGWLQRRIPLLKLDVEGYEIFVLRGGRKLLKGTNIENIIVEQNFNNLDEALEMMDMIWTAGYVVKQLGDANGNPYHVEAWQSLNGFLEERSKEEGILPRNGNLAEELAFLNAKASFNMWWIRKNKSKESSSS